MGKTFRKNIEYGGGTSASRVNRYRTHNRSKKSGSLNTDTDEFRRGRNYKKSKFVWNTTPHGRRAPGRKGMPKAYAASARARQQQHVDRQFHQLPLVENNREEKRCEEAYWNVFGHRALLNEDELVAITEWNTPLILKAGSATFQMNDTYSYTLTEDHYDSTPCLVRKIGDKFYCITVEMIELLRATKTKTPTPAPTPAQFAVDGQSTTGLLTSAAMQFVALLVSSSMHR